MTLLRFHVYFMFAFCIQFITHLMLPSNPEFSITILFLIFNIGLAFLTRKFIVQENIRGTRAVFLAYVVILIYMIFKVVFIWRTVNGEFVVLLAIRRVATIYGMIINA